MRRPPCHLERVWVPRAVAAGALILVVARLAGVLLFEQAANPDWHAYYRGAADLRAGLNPYLDGLTLIDRNSFDFWVQSDNQYVYPPLLALLLIPLTFLGQGAAGPIWLGVLTLSTAGFLWATPRVLDRPIRLHTLAPIAVPIVASAPLLWSLRFGQVDVLLLLLTTLSLLAHRRRRKVLAGIALGAAAAIKPPLALYGLFYLRKRCWTTLAAATITGTILGLGPFLALGSDAFGDWLAVARYFGSGDFLAYPHNHSVRGLLLRAFAGGPRHEALLAAPILADVLWAAFAILAFVVWWRLLSGRRDPDRRTVAEYALTAVLILFVGPLSEGNHYVAVLLPLAVVIDRALRPPWSAWWVLPAVIAAVYYAHQWVEFPYDQGDTAFLRWLGSGLYLYGLLPIGAGLIGILRERNIACRLDTSLEYNDATPG